MKKILVLSLIVFFGICLSTKMVCTAQAESWGIQLQDVNIEELSNTGHNICVVDYSRDGSYAQRYTSFDVCDLGFPRGKTVFSYISIGEAEDYRDVYWQPSWNTNPPSWLGKENPDWRGNYKVRYWESEWQEKIFGWLDVIIEAQFRGAFLDVIDAFEYWGDPATYTTGGETRLPGDPQNEEEAAQRMVDFVVAISDYCKAKKPNFKLIAQNSERIIDLVSSENAQRYLDAIYGLSVEDLFYNGTQLNQEEDINYRLNTIKRFQEAGKVILSVDYVDDGSGFTGSNKDRILDYYNRAVNEGILPYAAISDRALDEINNKCLLAREEMYLASLPESIRENYPGDSPPGYGDEGQTGNTSPTECPGINEEDTPPGWEPRNQEGDVFPPDWHPRDLGNDPTPPGFDETVETAKASFVNSLAAHDPNLNSDELTYTTEDREDGGSNVYFLHEYAEDGNRVEFIGEALCAFEDDALVDKRTLLLKNVYNPDQKIVKSNFWMPTQTEDTFTVDYKYRRGELKRIVIYKSADDPVSSFLRRRGIKTADRKVAQTVLRKGTQVMLNSESGEIAVVKNAGTSRARTIYYSAVTGRRIKRVRGEIQSQDENIAIAGDITAISKIDVLSQKRQDAQDSTYAPPVRNQFINLPR